jgi:hypothetical protein
MPETVSVLTQGDPCNECNQRGYKEVSRFHSTGCIFVICSVYYPGRDELYAKS